MPTFRGQIQPSIMQRSHFQVQYIMICLERGFLNSGELPEFSTATCEAREDPAIPTSNDMQTDKPPSASATPTRAHSAPAQSKSSKQQKSWLTKFKFSENDSKASAYSDKIPRRSGYFSHNSNEKRPSENNGDGPSVRSAQVGAFVYAAITEQT